MYDVPFESQYEGITNPEWKWRGCGIIALHMVMRYWYERDVAQVLTTIDKLLTAGLSSGVYLEGIGWSHRGLAGLAKSFGYVGFNVDHAAKGPTPKDERESWRILKDELRKGPILASMYHNLDPERGGGHIVVVTGFADGLVSFNDPEEINEFEGKKIIVLEQFLRGFKRRFIVIRPYIQNM